MVIHRAQLIPVPDSEQLKDDIVKLEGVLNEISEMIDKFKTRKTSFKNILRANSDKEDIKAAKTRLSDMLNVFNAARAVENQQSTAGNGKNLNKSLIVSSRKTLYSAGVRENGVDTQGKQSSRILTVSYLTPSGIGPEIAFAGTAAFFLHHEGVHSPLL
ncbi:hypothetical protein BDQ17DRAFT_311537 [Cyathus striatus]|nr:hypothetical protein BDQ17DRAFT_311537 [Cyathus striatus]